VAVATPFDKRLAELSASLDSTRLYYGSEEDKARGRVTSPRVRSFFHAVP
jgi:hypothetical protein